MATGRRPVISVKRGGVTTGRQSTVRGRITRKRLGSSPVSLKSQSLIKPILSLDSLASLIATECGELWDYGLLFITIVALKPWRRWILCVRWSMADWRPYKGYGRLKEAGASLVGD